ncbi:uncharacterized protein LOC129295388 isoform X2 [Prosopis cineraria]|uniref:uncharacterized protein LOC129295388 isoform X2 n=1 Tax=Prosopis cineraria TaxID=364024 RepID=UPI0024104597|nr:uncharacterized protein LOC129295388 isoform X2 [Prosopis cineraria]
MRSSDNASLFAADSKSKKSYPCVIFPAAGLLCVVTFVTSSFFAEGCREKLIGWRTHNALQSLETDKCKNQCRPRGSETLPQGIVSNTSDFKMRRIWDPPGRSRVKMDIKANMSTNLFAVTVGIKQKDLVSKMVQKFLASDFIVMLFHYDGIVDKWKGFEWSDQVIHVSAINQSKWWFAKRFLHPDIVADYGYIFLWDEDLGVENFHPDKYVSIIKREGLEVSQPALDPKESEVHHQITVRGKSEVHRRTYKAAGSGKGCDDDSTAPPCTGYKFLAVTSQEPFVLLFLVEERPSFCFRWIEMMAPVFSGAAWRCVWYMIQSDLVHAWGLDIQLGYCAQGDRTKNVGVVDAEYIAHYNRPTLGASLDENTEVSSQAKDHRVDVRRLSFRELREFRKRWKAAVERDECWKDPFK